MTEQEFLARSEHHLKKYKKRRWPMSISGILLLCMSFDNEIIMPFIFEYTRLPYNVFMLLGTLLIVDAIRSWFETDTLYLLHSARDIIKKENDR